MKDKKAAVLTIFGAASMTKQEKEKTAAWIWSQSIALHNQAAKYRFRETIRGDKVRVTFYSPAAYSAAGKKKIVQWMRACAHQLKSKESLKYAYRFHFAYWYSEKV